MSSPTHSRSGSLHGARGVARGSRRSQGGQGRSQGGQGMVELAFFLPVFLLLFGYVIDYARLELKRQQIFAALFAAQRQGLQTTSKGNDAPGLSAIRQAACEILFRSKAVEIRGTDKNDATKMKAEIDSCADGTTDYSPTPVLVAPNGAEADPNYPTEQVYPITVQVDVKPLLTFAIPFVGGQFGGLWRGSSVFRVRVTERMRTANAVIP